jgi:Lsr2
VAKQVSVTLVDDLDGSQASETLTFALDSRQYELDLSEANAAKLRDALAPFVAAARRSGGGRRGRAGGGGSKATPSIDDQGKNAAIREWARQHGHEVSDRGRISRSVLDAYRNEVG